MLGKQVPSGARRPDADVESSPRGGIPPEVCLAEFVPAESHSDVLCALQITRSCQVCTLIGSPCTHMCPTCQLTYLNQPVQKSFIPKAAMPDLILAQTMTAHLSFRVPPLPFSKAEVQGPPAAQKPWEMTVKPLMRASARGITEL